MMLFKALPFFLVHSHLTAGFTSGPTVLSSGSRHGHHQNERNYIQTQQETLCNVALHAAGNNNNMMTSEPKKSEVLAGRDGYSRLRQPVQWDMNSDPTFDVPNSRNEDDGSRLQEEDSLWWSEISGGGQKSSSSNNNVGMASTSTTGTEEEEEELNLYQRTLDTLDYPRVLRSLYKECTTVPARKIVKQATMIDAKGGVERKAPKVPKAFRHVYKPLESESAIEAQERYRAVEEMQMLLPDNTITTYDDDDSAKQLDGYFYKNRKGYKETLAGRPPPFRGNSFNLDEVLEIADEGRVLEGPEILEVSTMLDAFEDIILWSQALGKIETPSFVELPKIASCLSVNATLQDLLHNAFDKEGKLSGKTFPAIGNLRAKVRSFKSSIIGTLDSLLAMPSIKSKLSLESGGALYSEVSGGRLVIPVQPSSSGIGIVHDSSRSGKTVYVEPTEIVGPTNELRQTEAELRKEEERVWRSLTEQIMAQRVELEASVQSVGQLDLVLARLLLGRKIGGVIPKVEDEGVISLRDARHPVLLLRGKENVVGSDIDIGADGNQGLVLTGPNAGGKTVILKLLGLVALMARGGIPVPAKATTTGGKQPRVDFFGPVLADIGDLQSVGGDLSTFSGHMLVCREILSNSGKNALVLMDELGSGTDPNQGVALAQAILESLIETGSRVAITTHYLQLKQLAASDERFAVAGMQFVNGQPTYKLLPGTVGESFALAVAERLELPQSILDRATELLDSETRQMGDLIRELEDQKALADQQLVELEERKKEMARMEMQLKGDKVKLEKKQLSARRDEAQKFAKKLEEKEKVLEDILGKLKADPSRKIIAKSWDNIKFVKRDAISEAENVPSVMARKKKAADKMEEARAELVPLAEIKDKPQLKSGDSLVVCAPGGMFGREAKFVKELGGRRMEVQVSGMTVALKLTEVALPTGKITFSAASGGGGVKLGKGKSSISKKAEKMLQAEGNQAPAKGALNGGEAGRRKKGTVAAIRTDANTVDVRGCNLEEAKGQIWAKFSSTLSSNRSAVFILHGHGSGGVLKSKLRQWLKAEQRKQVIKSWRPGDSSEGGDAFTMVEIR